VAEVVVVVVLDAGETGSGMVVEVSRVVVVDVTGGGVEEHAATRRAAEQQRARRRMAMFFIADDLVEEFRGGTSRDGKSGQQAKREPENGDHAGEYGGGFVIHPPSLGREPPGAHINFRAHRLAARRARFVRMLRSSVT
jgi:hypothetical protein